MLAARAQENLVLGHQNGAAMKQQQGQARLHPKTPGARYPKTPIKIPLNDENAAHVVGGAKGNLTGRARGNENVLTSKAFKGLDKSSFVTPMEPRNRAVLGNKTTNAKAKASQPASVKSVVRDVEKSHTKAPSTVLHKAKQPHAETHKLVVHAEATHDLSDDGDVEYCPPKPKDLPYKSDVFPDGVLTFEGLKRENLFRGYYDYYINPIDEHGVSLADRQLAERTRKAIEECDRRVKEDIENFDWAIEDELEEAGIVLKKKANPPVPNPVKSDKLKQPSTRKAPSTIVFRDAAAALAMDDTTKSLQRRVAKTTQTNLPRKKETGLVIPSLRSARQPTTRLPVVSRKTPTERKGIEVNSRTTIGYSKGRATASALEQDTMKPDTTGPRDLLPQPDTTVSNDSDKTIAPACYAQKQAAAAAEDQEWKERVPFLSIFNPDLGEDLGEDEVADSDSDLLGGGLLDNFCDEEDDDFELKLAD